MNWIYKGVSNFCFLTFKLLYGIKIIGKEHVPDAPAIIACNHSSYFDPPIIGSCSPREIHFLANARLFQNRYFSWLITQLNSHPVNVEEQDTKALKTVMHLLKEGNRVLIFPEGGRNDDGTLLPFKKGIGMLSLHCNVPIVPTYIGGADLVWPKKRKRPFLSGKLLCVFGKPVSPKEFQGVGKKEAQQLITETVRQKIIEMRNHSQDKK